MIEKGPQQKVAVIDEDVRYSSALISLLNSLGAGHIDWFQNPQDLIEELHNNPNPYGLVLLNVVYHSPQGLQDFGVDFLKQMKQGNFGKQPFSVIAFSTTDSDEQRETCLMLGAKSYHPKLEDPQNIINDIVQVLNTSEKDNYDH